MHCKSLRIESGRRTTTTTTIEKKLLMMFQFVSSERHLNRRHPLNLLRKTKLNFSYFSHCCRTLKRKINSSLTMEKRQTMCNFYIHTQQESLNWRDELEALSVFFKELNFFSQLSLKEGSSNGGGFVLLQTIMTVLDFLFTHCSWLSLKTFSMTLR